MCWLAGFAVALVLVASLLIVKSELEERKEKSERRLKGRMQSVFLESLELKVFMGDADARNEVT